jgi:DNA-binding SARP family transcriptional activator
VSRTRSSLRLDLRPSPLADRGTCEVVLGLLDGFDLEVVGRPVRLPLGAQRVVAFVALHERPLQRLYVAGSLWLDSPEARAAANLRSALWRIQRLAPSLLEIDPRTLRLGAGVRVDLREAERLARAELDGGESELGVLGADLLPDWYDDWMLIERERFRQLRMRALEAACRRLTQEERLDEALEAGLMAVAAEPLRESAHRTLVLLHLAAGNAVEARRQYQLCRHLLRSQLGLEPSERMRELVSGLKVEGRVAAG